MRIRALIGLLLGMCTALAACSGGADVLASSSAAASGCTGSCATAATYLTVADVQTILAQAVAEAKAQGPMLATIAVVDRVGNVLAVYRMGSGPMGDPAAHVVAVSSSIGNGTLPVKAGLDGITLPTPLLAGANLDQAAAISKAVTGAYLSSEGNAFSTRTANQIVQSHFNPGVDYQPSGPLFGVQFSQLPCSDFSRRFAPGLSVGPHRSPLGMAADPGGFPLYKGGTVVGGVGVIADGVYGVDADITNVDSNLDEAIAIAGTVGYEAPVDRRADRIAVNGNTLRFTDIEISGLKSTPAEAPAFTTLGATGALIAVPGYTDGTVHAGTAFGQPASGVVSDGNLNFPGQDAFVFVDDAGKPRYPPIDAMDTATLGGASLTANEVLTVLRSALDIANRARAQIRTPLSTPARVTISVVDTQGNILGMVRGRDAPVFGSDVSVQKGRTAALFSSSTAGVYLTSLPNAKYIDTATFTVTQSISFSSYLNAVRAFTGRSTMLADGEIAFTDRANGNLSRPFFPDGIDGTNAGPFSKPAGQWSPFSTGLQLDLSINAILQHVLFLAGAVPDVDPGCAGIDLTLAPSATREDTTLRAANGIQIFPGSVPIYRDGTLVGGVGVSGDGVDQDDMIGFLGLNNAGITLGGAIGNAPVARRADTLAPQGTRLKYVECPQAPFIGSTASNVCDGL